MRRWGVISRIVSEGKWAQNSSGLGGASAGAQSSVAIGAAVPVDVGVTRRSGR